MIVKILKKLFDCRHHYLRLNLSNNSEWLVAETNKQDKHPFIFKQRDGPNTIHCRCEDCGEWYIQDIIEPNQHKVVLIFNQCGCKEIMIAKILKECSRMVTVLFILWLCLLCLDLVGCATQTIPIVVKPTYPTLVACPDLQQANANNIVDVVSNMQANYVMCQREVDAIIIYFIGMSK
jgi:hypothetical protein